MFYILLCVVLCIIICLIPLLVYLQFNKFRKCAEKLSGPPMLPFLGNQQLTHVTPSSAFIYGRKLARDYNELGYFRFYPFVRLYITIFEPRLTEKFITSTATIDKSHFYEQLHVFLGAGLLTSTGDKWRKRRKLLTPSFHFSILHNFEEVFRQEGAKAVLYLTKPENRNNCDIHKFVARFTLNMVTETAMGTQLDEIPGAETYREQLNGGLEELSVRMFYILNYFKPTRRISGNLGAMERLFKPVKQFTRNIIEERMKKIESTYGSMSQDDKEENIYFRKKNRYAMLDTLIQAFNIGEIDMDGIQEEVDTFLFEGLDTTSNTLMFTFLCLANYQDMQQQIYEEICECLGARDYSELNGNDVAKMEFLDRFIKETLRLYPPVPMIGRTIDRDMEFEGVTLPKNTTIQFMIFDLHRNPKYYPEPNKFDPDRFLPEETAKRHPFAYIPFSSGHRNCIGQKFAILEIKILIVSILYHYRVETKTKMEDLKFVFNFVLRLMEFPRVNFIPRKEPDVGLVI